MRLSRSIAILALSLVAACTTSTQDPTELHTQGLDHASAGEFEAAVSSYRAALGGADDQLQIEIRKDLALALCHIEPTEAADEFNALVEEHGDDLGERDYMAVGRELMDAGAFTEATFVVDSGIRKLGEAPKLEELIAQVAQAAAAAGDAGAMDALKGLGYVGD